MTTEMSSHYKCQLNLKKKNYTEKLFSETAAHTLIQQLQTLLLQPYLHACSGNRPT